MAATLPILIIGGYLMIFVLIGAYEARGGLSADPTDFFLAGRGLGVVVLTMTVFASTMSSWSYFGGPGFAFASGLGFLALSSANVFAGISIYFVSMRLWKLTKDNDLVSPVEFMAKRLESPTVGVIYLIVFTLLLIPYIALQPLAGGIIFEVVSGGAISHTAGVFITLIVMTLYVLAAGMRGVAWTDTIQGFLMIIFLYAIVIFLVNGSFGGFGNLQTTINENAATFSSPGPIGAWTAASVFSWIVLISSSTTMLPHVLVRYMSADSARTLKRIAILFVVLAPIYYLAISYLGVLGSLAYPGLEQSDELFVVAATDTLSLAGAAILMGGALSALISTADSQLLVISQMVTRDGYKTYVNPDASRKRETRVGRIVIVVLGILGGVMALYEPQFIFRIGAMLFAGLAMTWMPMLAALYWSGVTKEGVITSVVIGELAVIGFIAGWIPASLQGPFHYVIPSLILNIVLLVGVSYFTDTPTTETIRTYGSVGGATASADD